MTLYELTPEEAELIEKRRREMEFKATLIPVRPLEEITSQEKSEAFDYLYKMALDHYREGLEKGFLDDDFDGYAEEAVLELLCTGMRDSALAEFWRAWNAVFYR